MSSDAMVAGHEEKSGGLDSSTQIIIGMGLGIAAGVFFGPLTEHIAFIGEAFIKLMQMTILPYVVVTLILGFGALNLEDARRIAVKGGLLLLSLWGVGLTIVFVLSQAFPAVRHATFYSAPLALEAKKGSLLDTFIPENIFYALSQGTVPAIVLFSIIFGALLIRVENKAPFISVLEVLQETFENVSDFMFKFSPIGIFALTAHSAGTIRLENLASLQVYFIAYTLAAAFVALWVLPMIVSRMLGVRYGECLRTLRSALVLAFTTGHTFLAIPLIEEAVRKLHNRNGDAGDIPEINVLVPVAVNFPTVGSLFTLFFVLFSGWLYDRPLGLEQQLVLGSTGLLNLFGDAEVSLPFMLDQMRIPSDAFSLYMVSNVVTWSFEASMDTASVFTLGVLYCHVSSGGKLERARLLSAGVLIASTLVALLFALRFTLGLMVSNVTTEKDVLESLTLRDPVEATVLRQPSQDVRPTDGVVLDRIRSEGVLRVGYTPNAMPFAYLNKKNELVGYDISMAHDLARALGVKLEFVPFQYATLADDLKNGRYDVAMSAVSMTYERLAQMDFSKYYQQLHLAFLVPDHMRKKFKDKNALEQMKGLRIAVMRGSAYIKPLKDYLPDAQIIEQDNRQDFFTKGDVADAMLTTAEQGAAWTMLYPDYSVVTPTEQVGDDFLAYAVAPHNPSLLNFLNHWMSVQRLSARGEAEYRYWIQGDVPNKKVPRWSVLSSVLHVHLGGE